MKSLFKSFAVLALAPLLTVSGSALSATAVTAPESEYLVSTKGVDVKTVIDDVQALGGTVKQTFDRADVLDISLPDKAVTSLDAISGVSVETIPVMTISGSVSSTPNWGNDRLDQKTLPLNSTYTYADGQDGAGVRAYIVDTGVYSSASELSGRVLTGYDAVTAGGSASDCHGHGTHVAGSVAGKNVGVAPGASIIPVRVLGCTGASAGNSVIAGLEWVLSNVAANPGPAVVNMSLGGGASTALDTAVQNMVNAGITVVVAAGNSSTDACTVSPAREPKAITVAASSNSDQHAYFSNFGSCVDIYAPGVNIVSSSNTSANGLVSMSGTSMASPHVAGVVAKYLSANPGATPVQASAAIVDSALTNIVTSAPSNTPNRLLYSDPAGYTGTVIKKIPGAPTGVTVSKGTNLGELKVSWIAPTDTGKGTISDYTVTIANTSTTLGAATQSVGSNATTMNFTGLTVGTSYTFKVSATNEVGTGPYSAASTTATRVLAVVPSQPTNVSAVQDGTTLTTANVSWTAPASNGGAPLSGYIVKATDTATGAFIMKTVSGTPTSYVFKNLTVGKTYTFSVTARNSIGYSVYSDASTGLYMAPRAPGAPSNVRLRATTLNTVTVSWSAPRISGNAARTGYVVTLNNGVETVVRNASATASSLIVDGLQGGTTYNVEVAAVNEVGTGVSALSLTPINVLGQASAPENIAATYPSANKTVISWTAPTTLNFGSIRRYEIRYTDANGNWSAWRNVGTALTATITYIPKNATRLVEVRAYTTPGAGAVSQIAVQPTL